MLQARGYEAYVIEDGSEARVAHGLPFTTPTASPGRVT
jgi:hypothetical protein